MFSLIFNHSIIIQKAIYNENDDDNPAVSMKAHKSPVEQ